MKKLAIVLALLSTSIFANDFLCTDKETDGPDFTLSISVNEYDETEYTIDSEYKAYVNDLYSPRNPYYKTWTMLAGYYPTIGDGVEGYSVDLIVNKFLSSPERFNTAKFGLLQYRASGPEGYYSINYTCHRIEL